MNAMNETVNQANQANQASKESRELSEKARREEQALPEGSAPLTDEEKAELAENFARVRRQIALAAKEAGRSDLPLLLAATKTVEPRRINYAIRHLGLTDIGENRVQELLEKYPYYDKSARLHFIGTLQKNKVKYIVDKVCLIHSVDSVALGQEIEKQAEKKNVHVDVLLQVNTGREPQKSGFFPEELQEALDAFSAFSRVHVKGLMAVAPICEKNSDYLRYFGETSQIFIDFSAKKRHNIDMSVLSMGMSDSLAPAVASGSTLLRIGSALFGKRDYKKNEPTELSSS